MTDAQPEKTQTHPVRDRRDHLRNVFESITGTTVILYRQEEQVPRLELDGESPVDIETYLEDSLAADGLEDAIGQPDLE